MAESRGRILQQTIVEGELQSVLVAHHDVTNRTPRVLQVSWDENFIPFLSPKRKPLQAFTCKGLEKLVGRAGVEPATLCLKGHLPYHLIYTHPPAIQGLGRFLFFT